MTRENCLEELANPDLPRERAAYLLGYLRALAPQHLPPRQVWDRVLGNSDERINRHFNWGVSDALMDVLLPRLQQLGVSAERFREAFRALDGQDFLLWIHAHFDAELAERHAERLARIAARLSDRRGEA